MTPDRPVVKWGLRSSLTFEAFDELDRDGVISMFRRSVITDAERNGLTALPDTAEVRFIDPRVEPPMFTVESDLEDAVFVFAYVRGFGAI